MWCRYPTELRLCPICGRHQERGAVNEVHEVSCPQTPKPAPQKTCFEADSINPSAERCQGKEASAAKTKLQRLGIAWDVQMGWQWNGKTIDTRMRDYLLDCQADDDAAASAERCPADGGGSGAAP